MSKFNIGDEIVSNNVPTLMGKIIRLPKNYSDNGLALVRVTEGKELLVALSHWHKVKSEVEVETPDGFCVDTICRCAKCFFCNIEDTFMGGKSFYCTHWDKNTEEDAFCSYGFEVKKDEN